VKIKQRAQHNAVTVTGVTLLKRMLKSIAEIARRVAPSKAIAFDALAVYVRFRTNTDHCPAGLAFSVAISIVPSLDLFTFLDGGPITAGHCIFFKLLVRRPCGTAH